MIPTIEAHRAELESACREYHVRRLELFGSAAVGADRPNSDLDFLVEFGPLRPGSYVNSYFGLLETLEDLFGRRVDLVVAGAITNPYFKRSIEATRMPLSAA